eukprot:TRINITY_DN7233_c0_g1_i1.p1 TRINITY_DN7233_c0_g1~~TRINITY_DN7233_c0_g1_i1.p1  ORF type:complete len:577 (-),score=130.12 TRINITY_DN7233_c0_g1_i1:174-1829(-)
MSDIPLWQKVGIVVGCVGALYYLGWLLSPDPQDRTTKQRTIPSSQRIKEHQELFDKIHNFKFCVEDEEIEEAEEIYKNLEEFVSCHWRETDVEFYLPKYHLVKLADAKGDYGEVARILEVCTETAKNHSVDGYQLMCKALRTIKNRQECWSEVLKLDEELLEIFRFKSLQTPSRVTELRLAIGASRACFSSFKCGRFTQSEIYGKEAQKIFFERFPLEKVSLEFISEWSWNYWHQGENDKAVRLFCDFLDVVTRAEKSEFQSDPFPHPAILYSLMSLSKLYFSIPNYELTQATLKRLLGHVEEIEKEEFDVFEEEQDVSTEFGVPTDLGFRGNFMKNLLKQGDFGPTAFHQLSSPQEYKRSSEYEHDEDDDDDDLDLDDDDDYSDDVDDDEISKANIYCALASVYREDQKHGLAREMETKICKSKPEWAATKSKYLETCFASLDMQRYQIELKLNHTPSPRLENQLWEEKFVLDQCFLVVTFENPVKRDEPLVMRTMMMEPTILLQSPKLRAKPTNKHYWILVKIYPSEEDLTLLGQHRQLVYYEDLTSTL